MSAQIHIDGIYRIVKEGINKNLDSLSIVKQIKHEYPYLTNKAIFEKLQELETEIKEIINDQNKSS